MVENPFPGPKIPNLEPDSPPRISTLGKLLTLSETLADSESCGTWMAQNAALTDKSFNMFGIRAKTRLGANAAATVLGHVCRTAKFPKVRRTSFACPCPFAAAVPEFRFETGACRGVPRDRRCPKR